MEDNSDEVYNSEYYQHLLSSLTINSRALITTLTAIAEKNTDHAAEICEHVESRIRRCLPQYKLFAIYLLDSICKNVGNPYNTIFSVNLYKIFTETYLVVTDTPTRQNLINLFKTWATANTSTGLALFPQSLVQKIEEFIIKATTISQTNQQNALTTRITPEMLLREGNYLLQYIIMLNNDTDKLESHNLDKDTKDLIRSNNLERNELVSQINTISESILLDPKNFENKVQQFHVDLQNCRKKLDNQSFQQQQLLSKYNEGSTNASGANARDDIINVKIEIDLKPNLKYFESLAHDVDKDEELMAQINAWGKQIKVTETNGAKPLGISTENVPASPQAEPKSPQPVAESHSPIEPQPLSSSLGMTFGSLSFMDSFLGSPKNETTGTRDSATDADTYDPERAFDDKDDSVAETNSSEKASSLKRQNASDSNRVVKRVRFDI